MSIKITIPNSSSDVLTFGSGNTPTAAQIAGIDSGSSNGQLALYTTASGTSTERMRIDASGNVGIGTVSPAHQLDVSNGARAKYIQVTNNGYAGSAATTPELYSPASGTLAIACSGGERMRIDSSGNLLVGTTSNTLGDRAVVATANNSQLSVECTTASGTVYSTIRFTQAGTAKTQLYQDHGATRFYVVNNTNGLYLAANATAWTAVSDEREKENLVPIANAASKVASLRAVTGNYISDESKKSRTFLIAQDVQSVLPEAVDSSDAEKLGIQYTDVIPLLVAAIKELNARLTALENK